MVLNNAFVFHLGFKFEDKMHKSKNNENKLVSNPRIFKYFTWKSKVFRSNISFDFLELWNFQKCVQARYEAKISEK